MKQSLMEARFRRDQRVLAATIKHSACWFQVTIPAYIQLSRRSVLDNWHLSVPRPVNRGLAHQSDWFEGRYPVPTAMLPHATFEAVPSESATNSTTQCLFIQAACSLCGNVSTATVYTTQLGYEEQLCGQPPM